MPQSPYRTTVYPSLNDLGYCRETLARQRLSYEDGERDKEAKVTLLDVGENLLEHCEFLEAKLDIKVRFHFLAMMRTVDIVHGNADEAGFVTRLET